jgi:hypothetical protein
MRFRKRERNSREKRRRMSGCQGGKGLDSPIVVLYRWSRGRVMKKQSDEKKGGKTIQSDVWLAGTPTRLFCIGSSMPPAQTLHFQRAERSLSIMGNACSILVESALVESALVESVLVEDVLVALVLMTYLLSPLL